ncbi:hypothetical protein ULF88_22285 [Halopseudomonas pachastrellae]|nr:hypothetical protein [Halopseudomonas pachastrellae]
MTLLAGTALAALHGTPGAHFPGGGRRRHSWRADGLSRPVLNLQGSTLLFLTLFLFGLTVFTNLSWLKVMDLTGRADAGPAGFAQARLAQLACAPRRRPRRHASAA